MSSAPLTGFSLQRIRGKIASARSDALAGAGDDRVDQLLTLLWDAEKLASSLCAAASPTGQLHARVRG